MKMIIMILSATIFNAGCTTINVTSDGDVTVDASKEVITDTAADVGLNGI